MAGRPRGLVAHPGGQSSRALPHPEEGRPGDDRQRGRADPRPLLGRGREGLRPGERILRVQDRAHAAGRMPPRGGLRPGRQDPRTRPRRGPHRHDPLDAGL